MLFNDSFMKIILASELVANVMLLCHFYMSLACIKFLLLDEVSIGSICTSYILFGPLLS